jgi:dephospho-CoA kinase
MLVFAGLTGGIGCGKSSALKCFANLGWLVIDADKICHELYEQKNRSLIDALKERWQGRGILKGDVVDRKKIAGIVFNDRDELNWLNSVMHPLAMKEAENILSENRASHVIFDAPLLFEAGWEKKFNFIVSVWTSIEKQRRRLRERGWPETEFERRSSFQMSPDEKLEKADFGIINTDSLESLNKQCSFLDKKMRMKI